MSRRWSGRHRALLLAVLALALVLRLGVVAATDGYKPIYDAADFNRIAWSIASVGHYPDTYYAKPGTTTALNPPGYPHLLAATYKVVGHSLTAGRVLGALLGTLTVLLLALLAWRLAGPAAGLITGALAAVYPPLVATNASLLSEAVFLPLVLGVMLLLTSWRRLEGRAGVAIALAAGVLCGLAALTRFVGVMLVLVVLIWIWQRDAPARRRALLSVVAVIAAAVTISPWTLRNARDLHEFVPIATEGGTTAAGTYNAVTAKPGPYQGTWRPVWQLPQYKKVLNADLNEAQLDRLWRSDAIHYAVHHPAYPFVALARNTGRIFGLGPGHRYLEHISYTEMGIPGWAQRWVRLSAYLMTLLAILGLFANRPLRARLRRYAYLWLTPALVLAFTALILGEPRYRQPIDIFLVLSAGTGIAALAARRREVRAPAAAPPRMRTATGAGPGGSVSTPPPGAPGSE